MKIKPDNSLKGEILDIGGLDIDANGTTIHTTYGIVKTDVQDMKLFISMCKEAGLKLARKTISNNQFYLQFYKAAAFSA